MTWGGIQTGLARLAARDNELYEFLVTGRRLRLAFADAQLDSVDLHSAHFVAAAIERRSSLCILQPDASPRRSAFLFAYALLSQWWTAKKLNAGTPRGILYCGAETGIREQLAQVSVNGLGSSLADVFCQLDLSRGTSVGDGRPVTGLPAVTTAYGPTNAAELIANTDPSWIALDFGDAPDLPWLPDLMIAARAKRVPILAWGTNPVSNVVETLGDDAELVQWPVGRTFEEASIHCGGERAELLFHPYIVTEARPILINSWTCAKGYSLGLRAAANALHQVWQADLSSFAQRASQRFWRLYRTLETLHVPYGFHEAEVQRFWGMDSIERQFDICDHFQTSLEAIHSPIARHTSAALDGLREALDYLMHDDSPLWRALSEIVQTEARRSEARLIVLPGRGKKMLLEIGLLAKLGVTTDDLIPLRNWIVSIDELHAYIGYSGARATDGDLIPRNLTLVPHFVGLPLNSQMARIWPLFLGENATLVAHDFQSGVVNQRLTTCNTRFSPNLSRLSRALLNLAPFPTGEDVLTAKPRIRAEVPHTYELAALSHSKDREPATSITPTFSLTDEVGRLLDDGDDMESDTTLSDDTASDMPRETWLREAVEIHFGDGWMGQFDPYQLLNYINRDSLRCDPRSARSLNVGDSVLIVPYQRRQSLYAMIISKVHRHPAIEIHLALLRRWREDLLSGYQRWSSANRRGFITERELLQSFLLQLQMRGSTIQSAQAVQFWMDGAVLAPQDEKDVLRVGQVAQVQFLEQQYRRIGAAASRIRGLHRGLSNRLNNWLADRANGTDRARDNEVIDFEIGLTFGDIKNSLVIAEVLSARVVQGPFLPSMLGYIDKGGAHV